MHFFFSDFGHTQYYYISTIILSEEAETGLVEAVESEREKRQKQEEGAWEKDERALFSIYCFFFLFFFEASWFGPSPKNLPSSSAFSNSV